MCYNLVPSKYPPQKCDGIRPICGQCTRTNRPDDCEYTNGQGRSKVEILEENIARIDARIFELEHPDVVFGEPVHLYYPYTQPEPGKYIRKIS